jgi:putative ABC transport system permease protein
MPYAVNSSYGVSEGIVFAPSALSRVDPSAHPGFAVVDLRSGAALDRVARRYSREANVYGPSRPGDVVAYGRVQATPVVLAWLLAVLAAGVLAHVLVTAVRAHRRELAVLKTLGFTRRQVASSIAWMATTVVAVALVIGLPVGIALGRWTWRSFADNLGIDEQVLLPALALFLLTVAALVLGNLVAVLPARSAARTRPATVLRSE